MKKILSALIACVLATSPAGAILLSGAPLPAGPDVFLTNATLVNPVASTQTNVPFTVPVPVAASTLDSSHSIKVVDQDTSLAISCQEDNRASDITTLRFTTISCIDPSMTASEQKSLKVYVTSGAPAGGTDIAISDITSAFTAASYDLPVTLTNINGVSGTWSASLATALASGNSGWVNKSTNTVLGKWRNGGGLATEYIVFAPVFKSGTADPQIYVTYDVLCWKALRTAVNVSTNPILGCRIDAALGNAYVQVSSPVDDYYGLSVGTSGVVASYPNSQPSANLTLGAVGPAGSVNVTASSSIFTLNSVGQVIANGTGVAVINGYTSGTQVTANVYTAFSSTSLTSGAWTLYGINQPYASRMKFRGTYGSGAQPQADAGQVYLGSAWNNGTLTGGPGTYLIKTGLLNNYNFTASQANNSLTPIQNVGTNPMGYLGGGAQFESGGLMGNLQLYLETSGERADIGVVPDWDAQGVIRYDSNAAAVIFGNASRWATYPSAFRDQNTGLVVTPCNAGTLPACTSSVTYTQNPAAGGTQIAAPANMMTPWSPDGFAHDPEDFYVAYLLTGDFFWIENQQFTAFAAWMAPDSNYTGFGITKTMYASAAIGNFAGLQERGRAWAMRSITDATLLTPDSSPIALGMTKTVLKAWLSNQWTDSTHGFVPLFVNNTAGGSNLFTATGPRWTYLNNNGFSSFESGYSTFAIFHQLEQGMLDTNGQQAMNWWATGSVNLINNTGINPQYAWRAQYISLFNVQASCPGTQVTAWSDAYAASSLFWSPAATAIGANPPRTSGYGLTLSATSGTSITATLAGGNYFTTTAFYPGAWIGTSDGGIAQITTVTDANHLVVSTSASKQYYTSSCTTLSGHAFGTTSYSGSAVALPMAAPTDPVGTDFAQYISAPVDDYGEVAQANTLLSNEYGISGGNAAYTTSWGWTSGVILQQQLYKWNIISR